MRVTIRLPDDISAALGNSGMTCPAALWKPLRLRPIARLVRHVPPKEPQIRLPAEWMLERAADTPNNWVNVVRRSDDYLAQVGKETFDVTTTISLRDGRILSGTIDNLVVVRERDCEDAALQMCGPARPREIKRYIEITLEER